MLGVNMGKQLSPMAVMALQEALVHVYWYKKDLQGFLFQCLTNKSVIHYLDWNKTKREIVSDLIGLLTRNAQYTDDLIKFCSEVCKIPNFSHLEHLEDGNNKVKNAKNAVEKLKLLVHTHQQETDAKQEAERKRRLAAAELTTFKDTKRQLEEIKDEYSSLLTEQNSQNRGFQLEKLMYRVFALYDLDPKSSFKLLGEQIDGAFSLFGTEYLFEAKWQKELINKADLAAFESKVKSKLENTLGLFLSINGFSMDGVEAFQARDKVIILMDGSDLFAVLEERITLADLIMRKKQIAAREGKIYVRYYDMHG